MFNISLEIRLYLPHFNYAVYSSDLRPNLFAISSAQRELAKVYWDNIRAGIILGMDGLGRPKDNIGLWLGRKVMQIQGTHVPIHFMAEGSKPVAFWYWDTDKASEVRSRPWRYAWIGRNVAIDSFHLSEFPSSLSGHGLLSDFSKFQLYIDNQYLITHASIILILSRASCESSLLPPEPPCSLIGLNRSSLSLSNLRLAFHFVLACIATDGKWIRASHWLFTQSKYLTGVHLHCSEVAAFLSKGYQFGI